MLKYANLILLYGVVSFFLPLKYPALYAAGSYLVSEDRFPINKTWWKTMNHMELALAEPHCLVVRGVLVFEDTKNPDMKIIYKDTKRLKEKFPRDYREPPNDADYRIASLEVQELIYASPGVPRSAYSQFVTKEGRTQKSRNEDMPILIRIFMGDGRYFITSGIKPDIENEGMFILRYVSLYNLPRFMYSHRMSEDEIDEAMIFLDKVKPKGRKAEQGSGDDAKN